MSKSKIKNRSYRNPKWIKEMYLERKYSAYTIAKICKCPHQTIYSYMKKLKIPLRSRSEANKGRNINNLQGKRFGRLTVLRDSGKRTLKGRYVIWACLCACGNFTETSSNDLKKGNTRSCGCLKRGKIFKHGKTKTRLYVTWANMKNRCYNPKVRNYKRYGGRGIRVCAEWKNDSIAFRNWALNNGYADNLTIDRINNDGNYEPSNCQFITISENVKKGSKNLKKKRERERLFTMIIVTLMRKKGVGGYNLHNLNV